SSSDRASFPFGRVEFCRTIWCMNLEARFSTVREPVMTMVCDRSMLGGLVPVLSDEPGFNSTITASNDRRIISFDSEDISFATVTDTSLKVCLNWLWISGSPLSTNILKPDDVGDMNVPEEKERRGADYCPGPI